FGSEDHPFNPAALALGAEASFVAGTIDVEKKHVAATLRAAAEHEGSAFVEIYQNCNVFNDGAFDAVRGKEGRPNQIQLEHGEPIRFGADGEHGVIREADGSLAIADVAEVGEDAIVVHDAHRADPSYATALARLAEAPTGPTPIGVLRDISRPVYGAGRVQELAPAHAGATLSDVDELLRSGDTWTVT